MKNTLGLSASLSSELCFSFVFVSQNILNCTKKHMPFVSCCIIAINRYKTRSVNGIGAFIRSQRLATALMLFDAVKKIRTTWMTFITYLLYQQPITRTRVSNPRRRPKRMIRAPRRPPLRTWLRRRREDSFLTSRRIGFRRRVLLCSKRRHKVSEMAWSVMFFFGSVI